MPDAVILAPLALGVTLVVAGAAKLGSREAFAAAVEELGVPCGPAVASGLPWVEMLLGVGLLLPAPAFVVVSAAVTVLLAAYAVLVLRVVVLDREVDCDCFGGLGAARIGWSTAVRNLLLLVAAVLSVVDGARGHSLVGRLADLDSDAVAWLVGAVALTGLVLATTGRMRVAGAPEERRGIPYLQVQTDDGVAISLPELASLRPQLLVTLSASCSSCAKVSATIGSWPEQLPELDVRVLTVAPPGEPVPESWPRGVLHDPADRVATVLGLVRPSAVLLGADALLAGGPVHGASAVLAFYEEVREALAQARVTSGPSDTP